MASKYPAEKLTQWKKEINPAPIISARIKIQRENTEWLGSCPFHPDSTPSFKVWRADDGVWNLKCFGASCGWTGNIFQFVQRFDALDSFMAGDTVVPKDPVPTSFVTAVERVLTEAGETGWQEGSDQEVDLPDAVYTPKKEKVTFTLEEYEKACTSLEDSDAGKKWLADRGIGMPVARKLKIGYIQSIQAINANHPWVDKGWILFPTFDLTGKIITAVKYRSIVGKHGRDANGKKIEGFARAMNTTTSLYNLQAVRPDEDVWIVEGEPDALVLTQAGVIAVALPGGNYKPTDEEIELLSTAKIRFMAGDNDSEGQGQKAMAELKKRLRGETYDITWPHNRKDANEVLNNEFKNNIANFAIFIKNKRSTVVAGERNQIEFHTPPLDDPDGEYVIAPMEGQEDGWFPLGDISLIGGASGTGKTTFLFEMLHKQQKGWPVLGHATFKRPFHVLAYDRGQNAFARTMRRLKLDMSDIPTTPLPLAFGAGAVQNIINQIEAMNPIPSIIFLEGLDMLIDDTNKKSTVSPFMRQLQEVAAHFHIALIGSLGAPKTKRGEDYAAKRDHLSGSEAWGRNCETVAILEFAEDDDGTAPQRSLTVLPRNANAEKFTLAFEGGRLAQVQAQEEPEKPGNAVGGRPNEAVQLAIDFLKARLRDGAVNGKVIVKEAHEMENISRATLYRAAKMINVNMSKMVAGDSGWSLPKRNEQGEDSVSVQNTEDIDFGGAA